MKKYCTILCLALFTVLFSTNLLGQIPTQFNLLPNTPDPFDISGTYIKFTQPMQAIVSLWIEDTNGNLITSLVSGNTLFAGNYLVYWNGKKSDSSYANYGIYVCKMNAASTINSTVYNSSIQMHFQKITGVQENKSDGYPSSFQLSQNYPNPFNPTTVINYSLPKSGFVTIKVYDVLGKVVTTLINEDKPVGNYKVEFNANKLTSGIYFYRMESGLYSQTNKLLLLK